MALHVLYMEWKISRAVSAMYGSLLPGYTAFRYFYSRALCSVSLGAPNITFHIHEGR